jgi:uncharacterized repeat protein (TIGR03803 family)
MFRFKAPYLAAIAFAFIALAISAFAVDKEMVLWRFNGSDGGRPLGSLVFDSAGNLYGTTEYAGRHFSGTVFELTPSSNGNWIKSVLYNFCRDGKNCSDGGDPAGGVILDGSGNLYGTTQSGGSGDHYGGVFELTQGTDGKWEEHVLYSFRGEETWPQGALAFDATGNLYGALLYGGAHSTCGQNRTYSCGAIFQLKPKANGNWTQTIVHSFNNDGKDGYWPSAGLTVDASGNIYGVTGSGGVSGGGTAFELSPTSNGTWTETILHSFGGFDGVVPVSNLVPDSAGNLYGVTNSGGDPGFDCGTIFELSPLSNGKWTLKVLWSFYNPREANGVILDAAGNLYGTTWLGGRFRTDNCGIPSPGCGTAFELSPGADGQCTETTLHSFGNGADGQEPSASLVFDSDGNLYGVTAYGGINNENYCLAGGCGTVFKVSP